MKRAISAALFFTLLGSVFVLPAARAELGRTPGTFAVDPNGAANYTIPIQVPPGPRGLQPNIALTYNSRQGNGYIGVGWGLSGLSSKRPRRGPATTSR